MQYYCKIIVSPKHNHYTFFFLHFEDESPSRTNFLLVAGDIKLAKVKSNIKTLQLIRKNVALSLSTLPLPLTVLTISEGSLGRLSPFSLQAMTLN